MCALCLNLLSVIKHPKYDTEMCTAQLQLVLTHCDLPFNYDYNLLKSSIQKIKDVSITLFGIFKIYQLQRIQTSFQLIACERHFNQSGRLRRKYYFTNGCHYCTSWKIWEGMQCISMCNLAFAYSC